MSRVGILLGGCAALVVVGSLPHRPPVRHDDTPNPAAPRPPIGAPDASGLPFGLTRRELATAGVVGVALGLLLPPLGAIALTTPLARRWRSLRRHRRADARRLASSLPESVDLLLLCTGAGLTLPLALPLVAARAPDPVGAALRAAERSVASGASRSDAIVEHLAVLGDRAAGLAHLLVDHLRYGIPLGPGLERVAFELRLARRRLAEEQARRLPVRLLAPLLLCVLPAFVLLTVVPLLVAALRSLPR